MPYQYRNSIVPAISQLAQYFAAQNKEDERTLAASRMNNLVAEASQSLREATSPEDVAIRQAQFAARVAANPTNALYGVSMKDINAETAPLLASKAHQFQYQQTEKHYDESRNELVSQTSFDNTLNIARTWKQNKNGDIIPIQTLKYNPKDQTFTTEDGRNITMSQASQEFHLNPGVIDTANEQIAREKRIQDASDRNARMQMANQERIQKNYEEMQAGMESNMPRVRQQAYRGWIGTNHDAIGREYQNITGAYAQYLEQTMRENPDYAEAMYGSFFDDVNKEKLNPQKGAQYVAAAQNDPEFLKKYPNAFGELNRIQTQNLRYSLWNTRGWKPSEAMHYTDMAQSAWAAKNGRKPEEFYNLPVSDQFQLASEASQTKQAEAQKPLGKFSKSSQFISSLNP